MCFPLHQRHILLEGHRLAVQALDRDRLDVPFRLPDVEALLCRVDPACNALARQTSAHIVVLAVDAQVPIDADRARKRLLMDLPEPVVWINRLWNRGQGREGRASHSWRLVAT